MGSLERGRRINDCRRCDGQKKGRLAALPAEFRTTLLGPAGHIAKQSRGIAEGPLASKTDARSASFDRRKRATCTTRGTGQMHLSCGAVTSRIGEKRLLWSEGPSARAHPNKSSPLQADEWQTWVAAAPDYGRVFLARARAEMPSPGCQEPRSRAFLGLGARKASRSSRRGVGADRLHFPCKRRSPSGCDPPRIKPILVRGPVALALTGGACCWHDESFSLSRRRRPRTEDRGGPIPSRRKKSKKKRQYAARQRYTRSRFASHTDSRP